MSFTEESILLKLAGCSDLISTFPKLLGNCDKQVRTKERLIYKNS